MKKGSVSRTYEVVEVGLHFFIVPLVILFPSLQHLLPNADEVTI